MTMNLPTPYTLGVKRYQAGATDSHGNPVDAWADPVDWPVYAYASGANEEPTEAGRDLSMVLWTVYAPAGDGLPGAQDHVVLDGTEYAVEGDPRDYSHDPWSNHIGGAVVYLKKANG
jgi:hypothetical protein